MLTHLRDIYALGKTINGLLITASQFYIISITGNYVNLTLDDDIPTR
jgi:hypothetical protein